MYIYVYIPRICIGEWYIHTPCIDYIPYKIFTHIKAKVIFTIFTYIYKYILYICMYFHAHVERKRER